METKIIAFIIILAVIGGFGYTFNERGKEIKALNLQTAAQAKTIKEQDTVIGQMSASKKVDESAVEKAEVAKEVVATTVTKIERSASSKIQKIKDNFASKSPSPENVLIKNDEIAKVQVDSLWEAFCGVSDDQTQCIVPPTEKKEGVS